MTNKLKLIGFLIFGVVFLAGCDQYGRVTMEGHEFRAENQINNWLEAVHDEDTEEACLGLTERVRSGLGDFGGCEEFIRVVLEGGIPKRIVVTDSTKLGGSDELGKGVYRYETNEGSVFRINRDKVDGVCWGTDAFRCPSRAGS